MHRQEELKGKILENLDFLAFYREYFPDLNPNGRENVNLLCPFHEDHEPSFSLNVKTGLWNCFGCGEKGDVFDFVAKREGLDGFSEALRFLAAKLGLEVPREGDSTRPKRASKSGSKASSRENEAEASEGRKNFSELLSACEEALFEDKKRLNFLLRQRGLSREVIERFRLGWCEEKEAYVIPYLKDGQPVGLKFYRPGSKGAKSLFWWAKGSRPGGLFPGDFKLKPKEPVILCEGEMDALCAISRDIQAVSGTAGAGTFKPEWGKFFRGLDVVIAYDRDEAGRDGALKAARILFNYAARVRLLEWPEELGQKGDLTDFFVALKAKPEDFWALVSKAKEFGCEEIRGVSFRTPPGYRISEEGVFQVRENKGETTEVLLAPSPVLITGRTIYLDDQSEELEVCFWRDGRWQSRTAFRDELIQGRKLTELARYGLPVISQKANALATYLAYFEHANIARLPRRMAVSTLGWKEIEGEKLFVLGETVLPEKFNGQIDLRWEPEFNQMVKGLSSKGSPRALVDILKELPRYQAWYAIFGFLASLAAPLLRLLDATGFIVSFYGTSSIGKTTALRLAAAAWGHPSRNEGLIRLWDNTRVFLERQATFLGDLPFFLDDSQTLKDRDPRLLKDAIYFLANGQGKGRGSLTGIQKTGTWKLVTLSTGEDSLAECSPYEGVRARILALYGRPFGKAGKEAIERIERLVRANYGHFGRELVKKLIEISRSEKALEALRKRYRELVETYSFGQEPIAGRLASYVVAAHLAGEILCEIFPGLPRRVFEEACGLSYDKACAEIDQEEGLAAKALNLLREWIVANRSRFINGSEPVAGQEILGVIYSGEKVCIFPRALERLFQEKGFSKTTVLKEWRERGWLIASAGRLTTLIRLKEDRPRVYALSWKAYTGENT